MTPGYYILKISICPDCSGTKENAAGFSCLRCDADGMVEEKVQITAGQGIKLQEVRTES